MISKAQVGSGRYFFRNKDVIYLPSVYSTRSMPYNLPFDSPKVCVVRRNRGKKKKKKKKPRKIETDIEI